MDGFYSPQKDLLELLSKKTNDTQESKVPVNNDKKTDDDPFNIKLRLDRAETHTLGVVCLPENIQGVKIDSFKPSDSASTFEDETIVWKSFSNDKALPRQFKSKKSQVDTDCYFMIVEHKANNTILVSPVSNYFIFEPHVPVKSSEASNKSDNIEERLKRIVKPDDDDSKLLIGYNKIKLMKTNETTRSNYGWDYKNEELSEDDNLPVPTRSEDNQEDPFYSKDLTNYGHHMKSLLMKQEEEEVDEELKQFSDDEDSQVSSSSRAKVESPKRPVELSFGDKVMLYLKESGKVTIKGLLEHFNIKEKNEDFRTLQNLIQKSCTMTTEEQDGKPVKFISLK